MTPFLYAIGHQKEALVKGFLQNGLDVNFRIQRRCWTGQMLNNIISYEMEESPEQHSKVSVGSGLTALHFSALNASAEMTALLLQYGADPNARSDTGDTPLHLAIRRTLLEHKYNDPWISGVYAAESLRDLITDHESEAREIYEFIDRYRVRIVETLLSSDTVDVNLANDQGDYPQHVIPFEKDYASSILCKLVAKGADSSRLNGTGQSCLHLASKAGNLEVVRKLVDEGHDIMLPDVDGLSPFHHALCGGYSEVVHFMSTACESLLSETWRSLDHFGKNPLHHHVASIYCSTETIDFLVQRGCNVNDADREGNSALSLYMGSFRLHIDREIFHLLLDKGADPLRVNRQMENLAHLFMHNRGADIEILQFLLKCGVDLAARDHEGKTVMHHGAIHGAFTHELVEFLRVNGVLDPYARDFQNKTPLDYVEEQTRRIWPQDYPGCDDRWDKSFNCLEISSHPYVT
jgi:ankyrin repeat protein